MNGKTSVAVLAMFCLLGMSFAFGGEGFGMEMKERQDIPLEVRADFMQATHEGDYETAMELHEEYGIGGERIEHATPEVFELRAEIFSAQAEGDWLGAVGLADQLHELVHETMQGLFEERHEECQAYMESGEVQELMEEAREAMEAGDDETAGELHEELRELLPEGCAPMHGGMRGPGGRFMPPQAVE